MGSYASKEDKKVDEGYSYTNGLYSNVVQDYDKKVVRKLIMSRKLAPFYKGRDEIDTPSESIPKTTTNKPSSSSPPKAKYMKNNQSQLYADAIECPICFLYYPSNINYSNCCDQPICTECFVQMKRTDPLVPASCPFCVQPNFGIIYHLPTSINQSHQRYSTLFSASSPCHHAPSKNTRSTSGHDLPPSKRTAPSNTRRSQKPSMIVLIDHIRPPLITSSSPQSPVESSLPIRRYYATDLTMDTPSFEDWMVMEAVRRSLQDQQPTTSSTIRHQSSTTQITSEDSSILC